MFLHILSCVIFAIISIYNKTYSSRMQLKSLDILPKFSYLFCFIARRKNDFVMNFFLLTSIKWQKAFLILWLHHP